MAESDDKGGGYVSTFLDFLGYVNDAVSANRAADAQQEATDRITQAGLASTQEAVQLQREMAAASAQYADRAMALGGPYRGVGLGALNELSALYGLGGYESDIDPMTGFRQGYEPTPMFSGGGAMGRNPGGQTPGPTTNPDEPARTPGGYVDDGPSTSDKLMTAVDAAGKATGNPVLLAISQLDRWTFDPDYPRISQLDLGNTRDANNAAAFQFANAGIDPSKGVTAEDWAYSEQKIRELYSQGRDAQIARREQLVRDGVLVPNRPVDRFDQPADATYYVAGSDNLLYMPNRLMLGDQPMPVAEVGGELPDFYEGGITGAFNPQAFEDYYQNISTGSPVSRATSAAPSRSVTTGAPPPPPPDQLKESIGTLQSYIDEEMAAGVDSSQATLNAIHRLNREKSQRQPRASSFAPSSTTTATPPTAAGAPPAQSGAASPVLSRLEQINRPASQVAADDFAARTPTFTPGTDRLAAQSAAFDRFRASPGYQFRLSEGTKAIDRLASAKGYMGSTRAAREAQRYGEGLASQEYGNYVSGLSRLAGFGESGTQQAGSLLQSQGSQQQQLGANLANTALQAGDIRMSGYLTQGGIDANLAKYRGDLFGSALGSYR